MAKHFEELWEEAENLYKEEPIYIDGAIRELQAKFSVYESLDRAEKIPDEEKKKLKSHTMGKILACLAQISLKDNINTFAALATAIDDIKVEQLEAKYR